MTKKLIPLFLFLGLLTGGLFLLALYSPAPLLFESLESKTVDGKEVFNRIKFIPGWKKDTWVMQQSHSGLKTPTEEWDRIAVVVDKAEKTAKFFQFKPGQLEYPSADYGVKHGIDYKVSCFFCHSNGPRAIRPNWASKNLKSSIWNKAKTLAWNLRIKSYGRLKGVHGAGRVPFRVPSEEANHVLKAKTCLFCHKEKGFLARGNLTRQNYATVKFMIESGNMPPLGFTLDAEEKAEIYRFFATQ